MSADPPLYIQTGPKRCCANKQINVSKRYVPLPLVVAIAVLEVDVVEVSVVGAVAAVDVVEVVEVAVVPAVSAVDVEVFGVNFVVVAGAAVVVDFVVVDVVLDVEFLGAIFTVSHLQLEKKSQYFTNGN